MGILPSSTRWTRTYLAYHWVRLLGLTSAFEEIVMTLRRTVARMCVWVDVGGFGSLGGIWKLGIEMIYVLNLYLISIFREI